MREQPLRGRCPTCNAVYELPEWLRNPQLDDPIAQRILDSAGDFIEGFCDACTARLLEEGRTHA